MSNALIKMRSTNVTMGEASLLSESISSEEVDVLCISASSGSTFKMPSISNPSRSDFAVSLIDAWLIVESELNSCGSRIRFRSAALASTSLEM